MLPTLVFLSLLTPITTLETRFGAQVITFDLNSQTHYLDLVVAQGFPGTDEKFASIVKRTKAVAAINGAYFDKLSKKPIGDIVVDNNVLSRGSMGTVLAIRLNGSAEMFRVIRHKTMDWSDYRLVLGCGPALVLGGKKDVDYQTEGFRDPSVTGTTSRMGVGLLPKGKIAFVFM